MKNFSIALHGGAGTILRSMMTSDMEGKYKSALKEALETGYKILEKGGSALDAVEKVVTILEDCPLFNAGKGSVFTADETHEMDASIMEGKQLNAGAVSLISGIRNPIKLARDVMEKTEFIMLAGDGAMKFAKDQGYKLEQPEYFYDEFRHKQWLQYKDSDSMMLDHSYVKEKKFGTVGAVACDQDGNIAAATSTGGMTNKKWGRIGDSPLIGIGNYANNKTCAVSCTGSGEYFIKGVTAYDLSCLMEFKDLPLREAADETILNRLTKIGGDGGLIAVDSKANIAMPFNTEGMYRAAKSSTGFELIAIYKD
ncbi:MAG: isoaspartyl peptidase/L-asparaginase [Flavobacteriaceae bacterium]|nr:isoaspartyl peptidase/L-asparaginase [Flavobacteriaceae bacterium]